MNDAVNDGPGRCRKCRIGGLGRTRTKTTMTHLDGLALAVPVPDEVLDVAEQLPVHDEQHGLSDNVVNTHRNVQQYSK